MPPATIMRKTLRDFILLSKSRFKSMAANPTFISLCCSARMATRRTGEADPMIELAENNYGKSRVRLVKVKRHRDRHDFREWTVEIRLEGDFESCFIAGDNSKILPT